MQTFDQVAALLYKQLEGTISPAEKELLDAWASESGSNQLFIEEMNDPAMFSQNVWQYHEQNWLETDKRMKLAIEKAIGRQPVKRITHRIHFLKTAWFRYAAAIVMLITSLAVYYFYTSEPSTVVVQNVPVKNDVLPGFSRAVLTLSNGQKVELNSTASETIKDGTLSIENGRGQLSYKNAVAAVMNTMSTPRGGQYQLTLSDGSRVWLNAASSITYPTSFIGKTREVKVTGEAYFEVAKDKLKPFIVKTNNDVITVLGTSFNVNDYDDEPVAKTSLLDGAIKINDKILQPGQAYSSGKVVATNIEQDIAWKNGIFDFDQLSVEQMVRQLARWYDLDIKFEGVIPKEKIFGQVDRKITLNELLKGYEGELAHFRLEGKTLFVKAL